MTPTERLSHRMEHGWDPGRKYKCGMCPSCYQREECPGGTDGRTCPNYLPPEPTRLEWPDILRRAIEDTRHCRNAHEEVHRIGRLNAIKDAMQRFHGFSADQIREIENDMHSAAGGGGILPG